MIARFIYILGDLFCPLPERAVIFAGYSTIVCPLCYSALLGLTDVLLSFPFRPRVRRRWECLPGQLQLTLMTGAIVPWLGDYIANKAEWSLTPQWTCISWGFPVDWPLVCPRTSSWGKRRRQPPPVCSKTDTSCVSLPLINRHALRWKCSCSTFWQTHLLRHCAPHGISPAYVSYPPLKG
jgi:hypothetical protein